MAVIAVKKARDGSRILEWCVVGVILGGFLLLSLSLAWQEAAIFDERAHVAAAYSYVRYGDMRLNPEHPPLVKNLAGIPLLFQNLSFPIDSHEWRSGVNEQWEVGRLFVFGSGNDADRIMFWARVPIICVALLLGFFVFRWTKELAGTNAGLFALLLYAADPNIIAHGHYVTTDVGIAAAVFIAFYYFVRFLRRPTARNTVLFGVFLGIAELTKFSAVLLFPYFGFVILLYALTRHEADATRDSGAVLFLKRPLDDLLRYAGAIFVFYVPPFEHRCP